MVSKMRRQQPFLLQVCGLQTVFGGTRNSTQVFTLSNSKELNFNHNDYYANVICKHKLCYPFLGRKIRVKVIIIDKKHQIVEFQNQKP